MRWDELPDVVSRSPFYRARAGASGAEVPLTLRDELLRDQLAHLPHGTRRPSGSSPVRTGAAGTGDDLLVLSWSAAELARERAAGTRLLRRLGVASGTRVANALPGALATPGALLLGDVVEELGALDVPLGAIDGDAAARQAWELVDRVEPEVIVLDEGAAFLAGAPARDRPWWRGIVWLRVGARGSRADVSAAAGFRGWQRSWLAVPEATSFVAGTCAAGRFHVDERVVAEVVDAGAGTPLPPGRNGTLVVTPLDLDVPLLRYATDVAARMLAGRCSCGEPGVVLELS